MSTDNPFYVKGHLLPHHVQEHHCYVTVCLLVEGGEFRCLKGVSLHIAPDLLTGASSNLSKAH